MVYPALELPWSRIHPGYMNEGKTHFTYSLINKREWLFFMMFFDTSMNGHALHSQSSCCVGWCLARKWVFSRKVWMWLSLDWGKVCGWDLAQCVECIWDYRWVFLCVCTSVHVLHSTFVPNLNPVPPQSKDSHIQNFSAKHLLFQHKI